MTQKNDFSRGSEWRIWDFHIHTPASFHWYGERLTNPNLQNANDIKIIDSMIEALNEADAEVFVLMDYFTFDGWFALQNRLSMENAPKLNKVIFPGIELRISAPVSYRMNAHLILNNQLTFDDLESLKRSLQIEGIASDLSDVNIIKHARSLLDDRLDKFKTGLTKEAVASDDELAKKVGYGTVKVTEDSYVNSIQKIGSENCIIMMPWDTHDGLKKADWIEHNSFVRKQMKYSKVFETRNQTFIDAINLKKTDDNKNFFDSFQGSLDNEPALAVSGSDAHRFRTKKQDRGYADFPSNKKTWIKADTTFEGLLQAIREPANRSYIGNKPPKLAMVEHNPENFIDSVTIENNTANQSWFVPATYELNKDLVAIIGNKGSGKSAFIDSIAHVFSDKSDDEYDNFVKKFQKVKDRSSIQFNVEFENNSASEKSTLEPNQNARANAVSYLPQGYFEDLCNKSSSKEFQDIINRIIFSYIDEEKKLSKQNYDELLKFHNMTIDQELSQINSEILELNNKLVDNLEILVIDKDEQLKSIKSIQERQAVLENKIAQEEQKLEGLEVDKVLLEQENALNQKLKEQNIELEQGSDSYKSTVIMRDLLIKSLEELEFVEKRYNYEIQNFEKQFLNGTEIKVSDVIAIKINRTKIQEKIRLLDIKIGQIIQNQNNLNNEKFELENELKTKQNELANSNQALHKVNESIRDSRQLFENNKNKISDIEILIQSVEKAEKNTSLLQAQRTKLLEEFFIKVNEKLNYCKDMFNGIDNEIENLKNNDGLDISLNFTVNPLFDQNLFIDGLKKYVHMKKGILYTNNIEQTINYCLFDDENIDYQNFPKKFLNKLEAESTKILDGIIREEKTVLELYNFLYSYSYVKINNVIQFKNTDIDNLSPGQRGELLIVLFLLLDKANNPILIDQPEENLDNQTIYNTLVPIIKKAKERRQVLMVTHNPNLAVVCDAEQIIYASFDRHNHNQISYELGSIESEPMKKHIVNVLEGTQPAFLNRQRKYGLN